MKPIYLLYSRFNFFHRINNFSRLRHCFLCKKHHQILNRNTPTSIQVTSDNFIRFNSQIANQGVTSKESENAIEVPTLQFQDVLFDQPVPHEDLIAAIEKYNSLADQMHSLVKTLSLSSEDIKKRWQFCRTMEKLFTPFFDNFRIQIFGSSVNCFGFKGCDIDMTFETTASQKDMSCYLERPDPPLICEVLSGKVSRHELAELPLREQLIFIHSVFLEYYKESEIPAKFINAHVPLIRFYHDKYNLKCDLTMENKVAYANTKLLYLFSQLDERVIPLLMTLRYWAKYVELIGKGLVFNTYTISLMTVYFLQTRNPPILPRAEYVLSLSDKFNIVDMQDVSFLDLLSSIPATKNKQSLEELFKEFFFFYLYFDFTRVICPLNATAVTRDDFFSKEENSRFRMNSICVQDPLCLHHNVAELVEYKHCRKFFAEIMKVCNLFQDQSLRLKNLNLATILSKPDESSFTKINYERAISLNIPLCKMSGLLTEEEIVSSSQTLLHVLEHVLLFDCDPLEFNQIIQSLQKQDELVEKHKKEWQDRNLSKQQKLEEAIPHLKNWRKKNQYVDPKENTDTKKHKTISLLEQFQKFYANHKLILCMQCRVSKNTWMGRELVDLKLVSATDLLEQERLISQYVAKQNALNFAEQNTKPFVFLFECYTSIEDPKELNVNFRPLQRVSFNPILGIFLKEYIPYIMKKIKS